MFDLFNKKWALTCVNAQNWTHFLSYNPLLTTEQGGVFLMPYLDEDGEQEIMPQA